MYTITTQTKLMNTFDASDKGGPSMYVVKMMDVAINGLEHREIRPGICNILKIMSRLAPNFR